MSPSAFRPLVDPDAQARRVGTALSWEPDPVLGQRPADLEAGRPTDRRMGPRFEGSEGRLETDLDSEAQEAASLPGGAPGFEPLSFDALTGPAKIEVVAFEAADGFEFEEEVPSLADQGDANDPAVAEDDSVGKGDLIDPAADELDGTAEQGLDEANEADASDPTGRSVPGDEWADDEPGEAAQGNVHEQTDLQNADVVEAEIDRAPPEPAEPMILESDHLAQLEQVRQATHEAVWGQAHAAGRAEGVTEARQQLKAEHDARLQALDHLIRSIESAACDPIALFGPLRRLSVHLAIELVRGELALSSEAIGRLIETCLAEIERSPGDRLVLALHPDDLERWVRRPAIALDRVELRSDPGIGPGSVRLSAGDTVIEDLIEHRLTAIATRVIGESAAQRLPRLGTLKARGFADGEIDDVG
ncbi:MAG: hypothetical protein RL322_1574 [Pseudomonadota bacterium]|jgi:flagellar biosynthesis/type III secretory pathway protein FliH